MRVITESVFYPGARVEEGEEALAKAMPGHSSAEMTAHYTRLREAKEQ